MLRFLLICFMWNLLQFSHHAWETFINVYETRLIFNNLDLCY